MNVGWMLVMQHPRLSDKQMKILITRVYLHRLWKTYLTYYRKRRKPSGARR